MINYFLQIFLFSSIFSLIDKFFLKKKASIFLKINYILSNISLFLINFKFLKQLFYLPNKELLFEKIIDPFSFQNNNFSFLLSFLLCFVANYILMNGNFYKNRFLLVFYISLCISAFNCVSLSTFLFFLEVIFLIDIVFGILSNDERMNSKYDFFLFFICSKLFSIYLINIGILIHNDIIIELGLILSLGLFPFFYSSIKNYSIMKTSNLLVNIFCNILIFIVLFSYIKVENFKFIKYFLFFTLICCIFLSFLEKNLKKSLIYHLHSSLCFSILLYFLLNYEKTEILFLNICLFSPSLFLFMFLNVYKNIINFQKNKTDIFDFLQIFLFMFLTAPVPFSFKFFPINEIKSLDTIGRIMILSFNSYCIYYVFRIYIKVFQENKNIIMYKKIIFSQILLKFFSISIVFVVILFNSFFLSNYFEIYDSLLIKNIIFSIIFIYLHFILFYIFKPIFKFNGIDLKNGINYYFYFLCLKVILFFRVVFFSISSILSDVRKIFFVYIFEKKETGIGILEKYSNNSEILILILLIIISFFLQRFGMFENIF